MGVVVDKPCVAVSEEQRNAEKREPTRGASVLPLTPRS